MTLNKKTQDNIMRICIALSAIFLLTSCASQPIPEAYDPPSFFSGFWHGLISPISLIGHIFDEEIRIYAFPNSGGWYDFGFLIGVGCLFGGGGGAAKQN